MDIVKEFIDYLGQIETSESAENLYSGDSHESEIRNQNLYIYLTRMQKLTPTILLVGEAPGYKGCKLTGIPFTSEKILIKDYYFDVLGEEQGYKHVNSIDKLQTEVSAFVVWNELNKYKELPVMWNIYPFHPFHFPNQNQNRKPSSAEIKIGKEIFIEFLNLFDIKKIGAVGKVSESGIRKLKLDIEIKYIRHPSYGGQTQFKKGLWELLNA